MTRRPDYKHKFAGHDLTKIQRGIVTSIAGMTFGRLGLRPRKVKTEEQFWKALKLVADLGKRDGEEFTTAIYRIHGVLKAMGMDRRREMIAKVDAASFGKALSVNHKDARKVKPVRSAPSVSSKEEFYKSWEWRTLRMEAIKQHGRSCQCCGATPGMFDAAGQPVRICVDHIKPISKHWNLRLQLTNLQILCDECNQGKGNWDETDYRPSAPDEWVTSDCEIDPALIHQLTDRTTGRLQ